MLVGQSLPTRAMSRTVIQNEFFGNRTEIGGAIFATYGSNITIFNSSFVGNNAANCSTARFCFGGVLYTENAYGYLGIQEPSLSVIVINESEFSNNRATNGAVLAAVNCSISISNSEFYGNIADECGGVLWIEDSSRTNIYDSDIYSNKASRRGGVVHLTDTSSIVINASRVYDNNYLEAESGGVIYLHSNDGCFVGLYESIFYNNSAQIGGVISKLDDNTERCMVAQSNHETSFLKESITLQHHSLLIIVLDSLFSTNYANFTGGVFNIENADNFTIKWSKFLNNVAYSASGGVFDLESVNTMNLEDVEFSYNQAQVGGVIRAFQSGIHFVGECTMTGNSAFIGGAIHAVESTLNAKDATVVVENCSAFSAGAGLYLYHSTLHCYQNSTIGLVGNEAISRGGGIYAINSSGVSSMELRELEHPPQLWHNSQLSSSLTTIFTDNRKLAATTNNKLTGL